ncbi:transposase [Curtobacterium sp. PvP017]
MTNASVDAHRDDPTFGYRFIADDLAADGHRVSERRVWRLCSQQRLWSLHAKKRRLTRKAARRCTMTGSGGHSRPRTWTGCG